MNVEFPTSSRTVGPDQVAARARPQNRLHDLVRQWQAHLLILFVGLLIFLPGLGKRDLWNPDEPRYAEVTREMLLSGDYLVPHLNGEVYSHKPPLMFWAISLAALLRGALDETATRLPSALSAVATLLVVFSMGRRLFGSRAGWYATAAFGSCAAILQQARVGQIDMLLILLVTLAVYFWARGYFESQPGFYWGFFAAAGLATLAKGPVGLLPPLLSIIGFLLLVGNRAELKRLRIMRGLVVWAAIVLAWLLPATWIAGREYFQATAFHQTVVRYVASANETMTSGHLHPWYYYLLVVPIFFLPWSLYLPASVLIGKHELRADERHRLLFLLCWVVVTLLFFSLSPAKRHVYVLTMVPALALIVGLAFDRAPSNWNRYRKWFVASTALLVVLAGGLVLSVPLALRFSPQLLPPGHQSLPGLASVMWGVLLGALLALWAARERRLTTSVVALATGMTTMALGLYLVIFPQFNSVKSPHKVAEALLLRLGDTESYATLGMCPSCIFYTGRFAKVLNTPEEVGEYVATTRRPWIMARKKDLEQLRQEPLSVVAGGDGWPRSYVLLGLSSNGRSPDSANSERRHADN